MEKQIIGLNRATKNALIKEIKSLKAKVTYKDSGGRTQRDYRAINHNNALVDVLRVIDKY